jgi:hypothetical protein
MSTFNGLVSKPQTTPPGNTNLDWVFVDDSFIYFNRPQYSEMIQVTATATPTVSNYQTRLAGIFGEYPKVRLFITDGDGNRYESMQNPKFIIVDDLVDSIVYDLGEEITGYILLQ